MKAFHPKSLFLSATAVSLVLGTVPALALDADAFGETLKSSLDKQGIILSYEKLDVDGSDITLTGAGFGIPGEDKSFPAGNIAFENVQETGNGYIIGKATFDNLNFSQDGFSVTSEDAYFEGLRLPSDGSDMPFGDVMLYDRAQLGSAVVKFGGTEVVAIRNAYAELDIPKSPTEKMNMRASIDSISADLGSIEDPKVQQTVKELGYEKLTGNVKSSGYWQAADGRMVLAENRITVDNAASFNFALDLGGYTPEFATALQEMSRSMEESEDNAQAQGLAMLGLLQQLTFYSASLRLEDASLTEKALDFVAKQQGTTRDNLIAQAKGVLPFMLAQLGNPDFAAQVSAAVSTYLDNPQSLEIAAEPAQPVPFAQLMATGMTSPQTLPDALSAKVTANQ